MASKDLVIQGIMDRIVTNGGSLVRKFASSIANDVRNAYNEGYRACEKEKASEYQRGYAEAETHYKDIIEMREKQAFDKGYSQCLADNDTFGAIEPFDNDYHVGDEVIADNGTASFVITSLAGNDVGGIDSEGGTYAYLPSEICYKTGRHFDVEGFLKQMKQEK